MPRRSKQQQLQKKLTDIGNLISKATSMKALGAKPSGQDLNVTLANLDQAKAALFGFLESYSKKIYDAEFFANDSSDTDKLAELKTALADGNKAADSHLTGAKVCIRDNTKELEKKAA